MPEIKAINVMMDMKEAVIRGILEKILGRPVTPRDFSDIQVSVCSPNNSEGLIYEFFSYKGISIGQFESDYIEGKRVLSFTPAN